MSACSLTGVRVLCMLTERDEVRHGEAAQKLESSSLRVRLPLIDFAATRWRSDWRQVRFIGRREDVGRRRRGGLHRGRTSRAARAASAIAAAPAAAAALFAAFFPHCGRSLGPRLGRHEGGSTNAPIEAGATTEEDSVSHTSCHMKNLLGALSTVSVLWHHCLQPMADICS